MKVFSIISGYEEKHVVSVPVSRGPGTYGTVQVTYSSSDITAENGRDYLPAEGTLTLGSGVATGYINVTIIDDDEREFVEQFELTLISVSGKISTTVWQFRNQLKLARMTECILMKQLTRGKQTCS